MIIAVLNSKGGVGKTTTSVNVAGALASTGRRILLVDLDSQASASSWCGVRRGRLNPSVASCLLHEYPVKQAIRRTRIPNLDLITGSVELASSDLALGDRAGREVVLRGILQSIASQYEFVVLDCPPGLSLLTINALCAADALVIPITPRHLAVGQLPGLTAAIEKVRGRLGGHGRLLGVVVVMLHRGNRLEAAVCARLRAQYRERVFHTVIPASDVFEKAAAACEPVVSFAPRSAPAKAIRQLAAEVLRRAHSARH